MGVFYNFVMNDPIIKVYMTYLIKNLEKDKSNSEGLNTLNDLTSIHTIFNQEHMTMWMAEFLRLTEG